MRIARQHWDEIVAHAREDAPNECCGLLRTDGEEAQELVRVVNERASPYGFELGFKGLMTANEWDDEGYGVAVYHSHPRSAPKPSQTDINLAQYPNWVWVIVSLAGEPDIRAWRIADGKVFEEELTVV
ncbi:MAG: M67 family metallopeptidase [Actinomycetota bacterium]|nr:M67 family metallopeptidase [Actinomycetota bacterium]